MDGALHTHTSTSSRSRSPTHLGTRFSGKRDIFAKSRRRRLDLFGRTASTVRSAAARPTVHICLVSELHTKDETGDERNAGTLSEGYLFLSTGRGSRCNNDLLFFFAPCIRVPFVPLSAAFMRGMFLWQAGTLQRCHGRRERHFRDNLQRGRL